MTSEQPRSETFLGRYIICYKWQFGCRQSYSLFIQFLALSFRFFNSNLILWMLYELRDRNTPTYSLFIFIINEVSIHLFLFLISLSFSYYILIGKSSVILLWQWCIHYFPLVWGFVHVNRLWLERLRRKAGVILVVILYILAIFMLLFIMIIKHPCKKWKYLMWGLVRLMVLLVVKHFKAERWFAK